MISVMKRGKVYQYRFEAGKLNGKRKSIKINLLAFFYKH